MHYKERTKIIAYINSMMHSCLYSKQLSHKIVDCPKRKLFVTEFLQRYTEGRWRPAEEAVIQEEKEEVLDREVLGVMQYVKQTE